MPCAQKAGDEWGHPGERADTASPTCDISTDPFGQDIAEGGERVAEVNVFGGGVVVEKANPCFHEVRRQAGVIVQRCGEELANILAVRWIGEKVDQGVV